MEPKAKFVLVGIFVSLFAMIGIIIVLWIIGVGASAKRYDIYVVKTSSSVGGLNKDADVRYKGVKVGKVVSIKIDKNNPQYIEIYIEVEKDLPIKTDTKAKISSNGLTGIAYINLIGGSRDKPFLKSTSKERYPVIKTVPTTLQKLSVLAAKVMESTNLFLTKLSILLNNQTIDYMHQTIKNIYKASNNIKILTLDLQRSQNALERLLNNTDNLTVILQQDAKNANLLITKLKILTDNTDMLVKENAQNIDMFTQKGFENINSAFLSLKASSEQLKELLIELKENPSILLKGVKIEKGPGE